MLAVRQGWKWLSTGEMLRESTDPEVVKVLASGELVSDQLTYEVFDTAIKDARAKNYPNIIVDGFPRTKEQAEWLAGYMEQHSQKLDLVVVLEIPEGEIMSRLERRARTGDTPEIIARRMAIYRQKMYPLLAVFAEDHVPIVHLDGNGSAGQIHDKIYHELVMRGLA